MYLSLFESITSIHLEKKITKAKKDSKYMVPSKAQSKKKKSLYTHLFSKSNI